MDTEPWKSENFVVCGNKSDHLLLELSLSCKIK